MTPTPPATRFKDRIWPAETLDALAAGWWSHLRDALPKLPDLIATVLPVHPEGVALFFALSALPRPMVILADDPTAWRSEPPLPTSTPIVLPPMLAGLRESAEVRGHRAIILPERPAAPAHRDEYRALAFPGIVAFTSGSTGLPKPVFRSTRGFFGASEVSAQALGLRPGDGIIGALPFSNTHGLGSVLGTAAVLGGPVALIDRFDHRSVLALFATRQYRYFPCTPLMADLLSRCALKGPPPPAPDVVRVSGARLTEAGFDAFKARFGVPLRPGLGSTESGVITVDDSVPEAVRWASVGRVLPGIEVRIGDEPVDPFPAGKPGRVWFRSGIYMDGYGFPPHLEPREHRDGWWPTGDLGTLDEDGYLTLTGRLDDCFKAATGQLVNPAEVAAALRRHPEVSEAAVVPIPGASGISIGALVESTGSPDTGALRAHVATLLPPWARPQALVVVPALPRNARGKVDRERCLALLGAGAAR